MARGSQLMLMRPPKDAGFSHEEESGDDGKQVVVNDDGKGREV